jgi:hypothetical protein
MEGEYTVITTYLTITRLIKKGAFYVYDPKVLIEFGQQIEKVHDLLDGSRINAKAAYRTTDPSVRVPDARHGFFFGQHRIG